MKHTSSHYVRKTSLKDVPVFGCSLDALLLTKPSHNIPIILIDCVEYLNTADRIKDRGIFRESGDFLARKKLVAAYTTPHGIETHLLVFSNTQVHVDMTGHTSHTVAVLLKEWLRSLPECLLTTALYWDFKSAVSK